MRVSVVAHLFARMLCARLVSQRSAVPAFAQPSKTVRILVGLSAGGGTDAIARTLAEKLKDELGTRSSSRTARAPAGRSPRMR